MGTGGRSEYLDFFGVLADLGEIWSQFNVGKEKGKMGYKEHEETNQNGDFAAALNVPACGPCGRCARSNQQGEKDNSTGAKRVDEDNLDESQVRLEACQCVQHEQRGFFLAFEVKDKSKT